MVTTSGVQRDPPKDLAGVLDESAQTLFMTELVRGLMLTLKAFFDKKVTVRPLRGCELCEFAVPMESLTRVLLYMLSGLFSEALRPEAQRSAPSVCGWGAAPDKLPLREGPDQPALPRRARAAALPDRRGALHRVQALRGGARALFSLLWHAVRCKRGYMFRAYEAGGPASMCGCRVHVKPVLCTCMCFGLGHLK